MSNYLPYGCIKDENFEKFQIKNLSFLKDNTSIRSIRYNDLEIIKMISFLIRDSNWNNYNPNIIKSEIINNIDFIKLYFDLEFSDNNQKLITKNTYIFKNNSIKFISRGKFLTKFITNRSGFNILFPLNNISGKKINIITTDLKKISSVFPTFICPDQPFTNIKEISHIVSNLNINYKFNGIKFEMEDQRNWGDASYKVYSGSLFDPFPITINKNQDFFQEILITFYQNKKTQVNVDFTHLKNKIKIINNSESEIVGSKIGIKLDNLEKFKFNNDIKFLKFDYILIEFDLSDTNVELIFKKLSNLSKLNVIFKKIFAIFLIDHTKTINQTFIHITRLYNLIFDKIKFEYILICPKIYLKSFQPTGNWPAVYPLEEYYNYAKSNFPDSKIVSGMVTNFTELNRKKPTGKFDIISHSFTPIIHDSSDHALMETPETIKHIIDTIKKFSNRSKIHIGPICIGMHHNPYGESLVENKNNTRIELTNKDPRHDSLLSLVWSVGMYEELIKQKVNLLTFNSLFGFHGILDDEYNNRILYIFNKIILSFSNKKIILFDHCNNIFCIGIFENSTYKILISNKTKLNQSTEIEINGKILSSYINEENFNIILDNTDNFFNLQKSSNKLSFKPYETKYLEIKKL